MAGTIHCEPPWNSTATSRDPRDAIAATGDRRHTPRPLHHMFFGKILGKSKKVTGNEDLTLSKTGKMEGDKIGGERRGADDAGLSGIPEQKPGEPFVNHRRAAWERQRAEWVAAGRAGREAKGRGRSAPRRPVLSADATYDDLLTSSRPFPQPVPLVEMVDFLVEVWDEDGLYD